MKHNLFNKEKVRIILLGLLYIGAIYCAIDISRFHQEFFYTDSIKEHISHPIVSYPLFVVFSAAFLFLTLRKGLDHNIRKAFVMVYATTVSTVLILYKLVNLFVVLSICSFEISKHFLIELLSPACVINLLILKLITSIH